MKSGVQAALFSCPKVSFVRFSKMKALQTWQWAEFTGNHGTMLCNTMPTVMKHRYGTAPMISLRWIAPILGLCRCS